MTSSKLTATSTSTQEDEVDYFSNFQKGNIKATKVKEKYGESAPLKIAEDPSIDTSEAKGWDEEI